MTPAQASPGDATFRVTYYGELMSPALGATRSAVPGANGSAVAPFNLYGWLALDLDVFRGFRLLYFQRFLVDLADERSGAAAVSPSLLDPRLGLRRVDTGPVEGLRHTLDAFVQLPATERSRQAGLLVDAGFRSNASFAPSHGRWSAGLITDAFASLYAAGGSGPLVTAALTPWASITLTPTLSTQHWVMVPFQAGREGLSWDYPVKGPYIQNGVGWEFNEHIWLALFVNNHLSALPTLQNTWLSGWLFLSI
ncbi:MAG: hypothetical protein RL653_3042 [Pseudomonadota bacterium]